VRDAGPWADFVLGGGRRTPAQLNRGQSHDLDLVELEAPVTPSKVIAIGLNYESHAREGGITELPEHPMVFAITPNAVVGTDADVRMPDSTKELDFEGELAVVIGKRAREVSADDALDHVMGYTCANDVSARDWQLSGNYVFGKSADTFLPLGPWVTTVEEIADPQNLRIEVTVNGETRQSESTAGMLWPVARLIEFVTQMVTLEVGDVLITGTPAGVGFADKRWLAKGDVVDVTISRIGVLRSRIA
jgi:2-keto-4-pentenoate hydratase/2-oxohepta-3-ene-1,7-dioic acid hydratase in catechol pathway